MELEEAEQVLLVDVRAVEERVWRGWARKWGLGAGSAAAYHLVG